MGRRARRTNHFRRGFSLLELSMVLVVLSLLVAGIFATWSQDIRRQKHADLQARLDAIEASLINFRRLNNRLPCPADATQVMSNANYGVEGATAGTCTGGTPAANFASGSTVGGVVPVRTLGLPDEFLFDPWGGQISYAVDVNATAASAFSDKIASSTLGTISVYDGSAYPATGGNARTTRAVAVILSHGANGHGAYQLSGSRKSAGSTNSDEQQNCHCSSSAASSTFDAKFVQHSATGSSSDPLNVFDDVLRYYTRSQLLSASEATTGG